MAKTLTIQEMEMRWANDRGRRIATAIEPRALVELSNTLAKELFSKEGCERATTSMLKTAHKLNPSLKEKGILLPC